jgi:hypothetical protein
MTKLLALDLAGTREAKCESGPSQKFDSPSTQRFQPNRQTSGYFLHANWQLQYWLKENLAGASRWAGRHPWCQSPGFVLFAFVPYVYAGLAYRERCPAPCEQT